MEVQSLGVHKAVSFVVCVGLKTKAAIGAKFATTKIQMIRECFPEETVEKRFSIQKDNLRKRAVPDNDKQFLIAQEIERLNQLYAKRSKAVAGPAQEPVTSRWV